MTGTLTLVELFSQDDLAHPDPDKYIRKIWDQQFEKKPFRIDERAIAVERLIGDERKKLTTDVEGDVSAVLRYKEKECAVMSLSEPVEEEWRVLQLQGAKSRESFRITGSFSWQRYFANLVDLYAHDSRAGVRRITMPKNKDITHFDRAATPIIAIHYKIVSEELRMIFSESENLWIRDL